MLVYRNSIYQKFSVCIYFYLLGIATKLTSFLRCFASCFCGFIGNFQTAPVIITLLLRKIGAPGKGNLSENTDVIMRKQKVEQIMLMKSFAYPT